MNTTVLAILTFALAVATGACKALTKEPSIKPKGLRIVLRIFYQIAFIVTAVIAFYYAEALHDVAYTDKPLFLLYLGIIVNCTLYGWCGKAAINPKATHQKLYKFWLEDFNDNNDWLDRTVRIGYWIVWGTFILLAIIFSIFGYAPISLCLSATFVFIGICVLICGMALCYWIFWKLLRCLYRRCKLTLLRYWRWLTR